MSDEGQNIDEGICLGQVIKDKKFIRECSQWANEEYPPGNYCDG